MTAAVQQPAPAAAPRFARFFDLAVVVLLGVAYLPVFSLYAGQHWQGHTLQGAYGHAWLALAITGWLLWRQRGVLRQPRARLDGQAGWTWLLFGLVLKFYGDYQAYDVLRGASLVPTLAGLAMLRFGARGWRALRFPVLFLLFVIPLPDAAIDAVTRPLMGVTADAVRWLLPWLGQEVGGSGQYLLLHDALRGVTHELIVAPECSGIRSLVALLAMASLVAYLQGLRGAGFGLMLLSAVLLTLAGNVLRVCLLALGMVHVSPDTAETLFHDYSGLLLFVVNMLGLLAVSGLLARGKQR